MRGRVELAPCKECGHSALLRQDDIGWYVRCEVDFCDNCTEYFDTPEEASRVWNQRQNGDANITRKPRRKEETMEANNMALREFAEYLANYPTCEGCEGKNDSRFCESCPKGVALAPIALRARIALAEPPRNCDLPNPEERYSEFCSRYLSCSSCPHNRTLNELRCDGKWLLAPAKEKEGGNDAD